MQIEQEVWTLTAEGEAVIRYTLRNACGTEVQLSNIGAGIVALRYADRDGHMDDVVLGYKNPLDYFGDGAAAGKSVGRVANRIALGRMTVDGNEYTLERNNGQNHLHGGTKGYANRLWEARVEENRVVFSLLSEDGDCGYPGTLHVEAAYHLDEENNLEITYVARSEANTVVNLTNHTYWNLAGEDSGTVLDHQLQLQSTDVLEMNPYQIPTGRRLPVAGTPMDFRTWHSFRGGIDSEFNHIRDFRGYDHYFPTDNFRPNILKEIARLRCAASGREVTVLSSQAGCMVYTGNWLSGGCPETVSSHRYEDYAGVAIECQGFPDAVNHPDFPSVYLPAGDLYCQKIVFHMGLMQ